MTTHTPSPPKKLDVVLAGVGGQGVLSLAALLAQAARAEGLEVKLSEVHGMAQRGGTVLAHLRLSDQPIHSPLIAKGTARLLIATEPLEALRYLELLAEDGVVVSATDPNRNIPDYPEIETVLDGLERAGAELVEAAALATEAGARKASNVVLAGAATPLLPIRAVTFEEVIKDGFANRGEAMVAANLEAYRRGREHARCGAS